MKKIQFLPIAIVILTVTALLSVHAVEKEVKIPTKWFKGAKGYEKALKLQEETQADIFLFFTKPNASDSKEKGRCKWFNDKGIKSLPVRKMLREYIRVRVPLPANPRNQDLAKKFKINKTPVVYIVHPDGWHNRCNLFHWDSDRLEIFTPEELVTEFTAKSSAKYQPAEEEEKSE
jgi:uncharacterized protein YodC (DUF2158 family)